MLYLSTFDENRARDILQAIVHDPYNQNNMIVSRAAQAFLDNYHNIEDTYRACRVANWVMTQALTGSSYSSQENYPDLNNLWGFSNSGDFCDEEDAIYTLIDYWNGRQATSSDVITLLEQAGVRMLGHSYLDLNGDQIEDAVAMLQTSSGDGSLSFWLVGFVRGASGIIPVTLNLSDLSLFTNIPNLGRYLISSYNPGDNNAPILILYVEDNLEIIRIDTDNNQAAVSNLYKLHIVTNYQIFRYPDAFEIQVAFNPRRTYDLLGETLRWQSDTQEFQVIAYQVTTSLGIPLNSAARRAESLLFEADDPQAAIELLEVLAAELLPDNYYGYSLPEYLFYLAWAYELTGDQASAAQTYWQLWQSYPDSVYALIAFAHLEFVP